MQQDKCHIVDISTKTVTKSSTIGTVKNVPRYVYHDRIIEVYEDKVTSYNIETGELQENKLQPPLPSSTENAASIKFSNRVVIY